MNRLAKPVAYLAAAGGVATVLGAAVSLPFHGTAARLAWAITALAVAALAGALTPSWASPYTTRKDNR